jgi:geranylgeranyl reductase family protein
MDRFDVLVVGAGPGGSVAALVLARAGARVALLDKSAFPRDKACGDLVGPRGVQLLTDLGVAIPAGRRVGDMVVVGPTGRRVRLPSAPGTTYPGYGISVTRTVLDAAIRDAALGAGAEARLGRADRPVVRDGRVAGFQTADGRVVLADHVIGADGATSRVATALDLVDRRTALWGFALRSYVTQRVELPTIVFVETGRWRGLPGYGWLFPGPGGRANLGLGTGSLSVRDGTAAVRALPGLVDRLRRDGLLEGPVPEGRRLGGWLKMGAAGTVPARGRVLLVGDAAGLVNPLQGEGISQAMASGAAAAHAVLDTPGSAAQRYAAGLATASFPFLAIAGGMHRSMAGRPAVVAAVGRLATAPVIGQLVAGGWAIFWNDLLDGAPPSADRWVARSAMALGKALLGTRRRIGEEPGGAPPPPAPGGPASLRTAVTRRR